jgi:hypothetical protein
VAEAAATADSVALPVGVGLATFAHSLPVQRAMSVRVDGLRKSVPTAQAVPPPAATALKFPPAGTDAFGR